MMKSKYNIYRKIFNFRENNVRIKNEEPKGERKKKTKQNKHVLRIKQNEIYRIEIKNDSRRIHVCKNYLSITLTSKEAFAT